MKIHKKSHAKINWSLSIQGKDKSGYHKLNTIMQEISVYDEMSFEKIPAGIELIEQNTTPLQEKNIIYQAAQLFFKQKRIEGGVRICSTKNIPMQAGLGGGSSNAATTLLALSEFYPGIYSPEEHLEMASQLGADVAFFLYGGCAICSGYGEIVEPVDANHGEICLIKPEVGLSTAEIFKELQAEEYTGSDKKVLIDIFKNNLYNDMVNDLQAPAARKCKLLEEIPRDLMEQGAEFVKMSGSGSCFFGRFHTEDGYNRAENYAKERGYWFTRAKLLGGNNE